MKKSVLTAILAAAMLVAWGAQAQDAAKPAAPAPAAPGPDAKPAEVKSPFPNDIDTFSYIVGYNQGRSLKQAQASQGIELNVDLFIQSFKDGFGGAEQKMSVADIQAFMNKYLMAKRQEAAGKNIAEGKKFLDENGKKEGVKTTASGLQYKVVKEGAGATPKGSDQVQVNYEGRLTNGTVFDSSQKNGGPVEFPVDGVIKGWTEALQLMKEGGKLQIFVPAELAYGANSPQGSNIPPNSVLVFDVELLKVTAAQQPTVDLPKPTVDIPKPTQKSQ